ncbi:hypothetical protein [Candidatus Amarobacter glycogenicus]|uniref:hypothetical protein n=1 Tax=Candidatus Amarobacter glycogenicus TaxID=3140699 RepID=UPI0031CC85A3
MREGLVDEHGNRAVERYRRAEAFARERKDGKYELLSAFGVAEALRLMEANDAALEEYERALEILQGQRRQRPFGLDREEFLEIGQHSSPEPVSASPISPRERPSGSSSRR